jgi:pimeloyl-ACP methyl ester carboxylesterase
MHRPAPRPIRLTRALVRALVAIGLGFLGLVALIYFKQHSMIYHPRPYDPSFIRALPVNGEEISYILPFGKQTAFYIPALNNGRPPARLWIAFCGNGSLALDWTTILAGYPNSNDAFLLLDYPGYGKCEGYASIASMRASSDAALNTLAERLGLSGEELESRLCTIGHSLGSAVAIDFAARHRVQRVAAISPFTTLREEAAYIIGGPLSHLLVESYDNRSGIAEIRKRNPEAKIAIFHGTDDEVIPVRMGRELAREFPFIDFFAVDGANHVGVLSEAHDRIIQWMNN